MVDFCRFSFLLQTKTEGEMQHAYDSKRHQIMKPERDVMSRPKRPAKSVKMLDEQALSAGNRRDADTMSTNSQSNKENKLRPSKLKVRGCICIACFFTHKLVI